MRIQLFLILAIAIGTAVSCQNRVFLAEAKLNNERIDDEKEDSDINKYLKPYRLELNEEMDQVIGQASMSLKKALPEGTLGNWVADALLTEANRISDEHVHFAVQNYGGIRIPELPKGPITKGKIFELMPFDNMLVILDVPGENLRMFLESIAGRGGWPVSRGFEMIIVDGKPTNVKIEGEDFDLNKTYRLALPDYVANGGDNSSFFGDCKRKTENQLIRDILIRAVSSANDAGQMISAKLENRIQK